jgi:SAM-dependent methyltransferase
MDRMRSSKTFWLLTVAGLAILTGAGVRFYLYRVANRKTDGSPLPRKETDAPFIVTAANIVEKMLELAQVKKGDLVYDLGCGDGRIVIAAAKKYGCRAVGIDNNPQCVRKARENVYKNGVEALVSIRQADIFTVDFSQADVVTLYLLPDVNLKLIPQLEKLKPGARIVSHDFNLGAIKPDVSTTAYDAEDRQDHFLFMWVAPLKKETAAGRAK